ncbi:MAG: DUF3016 domain-containing protein [Gammaproteobacteria bacterium]
MTQNLSRLLLAAAAAAVLSPAGAEAPAVTYQLVQPTDFTDFDLGRHSADETARVFDDKFRQYVLPLAEELFPGGQHLALEIRDIDMAGEIQPWRNVDRQPVRYVEFAYPPKMEIRYQLKDAAGGVLAEGEKTLTDPSFDARPVTSHRQEPFRIEIRMLESWLKELAGSAS